MDFDNFAEITTGLYVGGFPAPHDPFELGATVVVCLTSEPSVTRAPAGGLFIHWPVKDGPIPPAETLRSLVRLIDARLREGAVVYVHCLAGRNRSPLVAARVLMDQGMTADEAIALVRARREDAISEQYETWLRADEVESHGSPRSELGTHPTP